MGTPSPPKGVQLGQELGFDLGIRAPRPADHCPQAGQPRVPSGACRREQQRRQQEDGRWPNGSACPAAPRCPPRAPGTTPLLQMGRAGPRQLEGPKPRQPASGHVRTRPRNAHPSSQVESFPRGNTAAPQPRPAAKQEGAQVPRAVQATRAARAYVTADWWSWKKSPFFLASHWLVCRRTRIFRPFPDRLAQGLRALIG